MRRSPLRCTLTVLAALTALAWTVPARAANVDLRRLEVTEAGVSAYVAGGSVRVTLDPRLQRVAERALRRSRARSGALVASDVRTGRILAWASHGGGQDLVARAAAPSASLFKVVTAATLLEQGRVSPQTRQCWSGGERSILPSDLRDDPARDTACTTVADALGHSVNLVFARLALKHLAPRQLEQQAGLLGFAGAVPIDVPVASSTVVVPADQLGMARAAAGFWNGRLSPLGALFAMQTIANRGERVRLQVLGSSAVERTTDGRAISEGTASALRRMLEGTIRSGTAARLFRHADGSHPLGRVKVAGKTGTLVGGRPKRMYSWFAGFASPSGEPEIAVAVLLANDVDWWQKAGEVARDFLEAHHEARD